MPFADHYLRLQLPRFKNPLWFVRVYLPASESTKTFEEDLDDLMYKVVRHALFTLEAEWFDIVVFGIADPEDALSPDFKKIMRTRGIEADKNIVGLYVIELPLSWEVDPRLRTLQERLQKEVSMAHPVDKYGPDELVLQHNTKALQEAIRDIFSIELDLSLKSLVHLDDILTMRQDDDNWRFHLFIEPFLVACGDYTGQVIKTIFPDARWIKGERPLDVRGMMLVPREKAIKLCCNGIRDSLETYVQLLQYTMGMGIDKIIKKS